LPYYIKQRVTAWFACLMLCCCFLPARAQYFDLKDNKRQVTIPFKLVRNLVVIQLKINNKGPYNFILDTGVGLMVVTEPALADSISIPNKRTIQIAGFGEGKDFEAYLTPPLKIDIPGLVSNNVSAALLGKDRFNISNYAGIPIHGLLGYEFFSRLAVKIDFLDSIITVSPPKKMRFYKRGVKIPISIEDRKPYLTTKVVFENGAQKESKLIIDLGAGYFISLENLAGKNLLQKKFIAANLGMGIQGLINGSLSRIKEIDLGKYKLKDVITAFPDKDTRALAVPRDGNIGIGLLKKFNIIFDYPDNLMYLKPNYDFKVRSEHDMTGLTYYSAGEGYSHIIIDKVEPGSAADEAGLKKEDEITAINFKTVNKMTLQQIDDLFKSADGRTLLIEIYRDKKYYRIPITLTRRI
jgi:hypothetical protein